MLRIAHCASALRIGGFSGIGRACVLCIVHLHCVLEVWQVLGRVAYCVLRICIAYWRALGGVVYCVLRIRIAYRRFGTGCVLRIAYLYCILESFGQGSVACLVLGYW